MLALPGRKPVVLRDPVNGHEPDIVAVAGVFGPWVAQTYNQLHLRLPVPDAP
jgi:hypothetical protein